MLVGVKWISDNYALHIYCLIAVICVYWNVLNIECHTIHRFSVFAQTRTVFIWRTNTTSQRWSCWTSFCTYLEMLTQYRTSVWIFFLFEEFWCSINLSLQITVSYGINTQTFTRQTNTKLKDKAQILMLIGEASISLNFITILKGIVFHYPAQNLLRISLQMWNLTSSATE